MKVTFMRDVRSLYDGAPVTLHGWLVNRRCHGKQIAFLDVADSTGIVQVVVEHGLVGTDTFALATEVPLESGVQISGRVAPNHHGKEVHADEVLVVGKATLNLSPQPRQAFDIFDPRHTEQLLDYRHIYLRNPRFIALMKFRSELMRIVRLWFEKNHFVEFDAPILTPAPLYAGSTAMPLNVHGEDIFLTQCAGFYLEAAAHALDRVYNMGPSFRGEESRSRRHLMEYFHIKAELAFGTRDDIMGLVESILVYTTRRVMEECQDLIQTIGTPFCDDALNVPYPRITYEEAVTKLQGLGYALTFGEALSTRDEEVLSAEFNGPFWIVGIPRSVEPFPYVIDPNDTRVTMVADLIASRGCGELLGVAEKIHDPAMLHERMREKEKENDARYKFVRDVHEAGCVPHIAFGMGLERLIRWLLGLPHVRDAIPFPRVVRRKIYP